jgi:hypothetical protein
VSERRVSIRNLPPDKWPHVLYTHDFEDILRCSLRSAQRKMKSGRYGECRKLDGKHYVLKHEFLKGIGG